MKAYPDAAAFSQISNGAFAVVVSAATGRIVSYGLVDGPNVLWNNPRPRETPVPFPGWINWGGDKVWIWPEEDWKGRGSACPPGDPSPVAYGVETGARELRMTSPVMANYGVRVVREISIAAEGSRVTIANRLEKVSDGVLTRPVGIWAVTQVPAAERMRARLCADAVPPGYEAFPGCTWNEVEQVGRVVTLRRPASPWVKMGLEADRLAVPVGGYLFVAETPENRNAAGPYERCRRAQVFSDPDDSAFRLPGTGPYVEMEFTSAMKALSVGESTELTVEWRLVPCGNEEEAAAMLAGHC